MARAIAPQNRSKQERKGVPGKPFKPGQSGNPSTQFKPGQSGNPGGKPKDEVSITAWLRDILGMTSEQAANLCEEYARDFRQLKTGDVPMVGVVAIRIVQSVVNDPTPGLVGQVWDRIDGTVETKVNSSGETRITVVYEDDDPEHQSPNRAP